MGTVPKWQLASYTNVTLYLSPGKYHLNIPCNRIDRTFLQFGGFSSYGYLALANVSLQIQSWMLGALTDNPSSCSPALRSSTLAVQTKSHFPSSTSYGESSCYITSSPTPKPNTWLSMIHERSRFPHCKLLGKAFPGWHKSNNIPMPAIATLLCAKPSWPLSLPPPLQLQVSASVSISQVYLSPNGMAETACPDLYTHSTILLDTCLFGGVSSSPPCWSHPPLPAGVSSISLPEDASHILITP